ncbi:hypothetical protein [Psychrobacillus psychrodurans]|uniref:hypothetical protein n=1 Tax=Psychrobacillus psychrodurans TaxID=126157 RepID=UPI003D086788
MGIPNLTIGGQAPGNVSEFLLDIENLSGLGPRYYSSSRFFSYQGNIGDYHHVFGTFNGGGTPTVPPNIDSINLEIFNNVGGEVVNSGTLEVLEGLDNGRI